MDKRDRLGQRGESLCSIMLTRFWGRQAPFFDVRFLGDKFQYADCLVQLVGATNPVPIFFVQVKCTSRGYTVRDHRLLIQVSSDAMLGLVSLPAPTYIIGIDDPGEKGYIISANAYAPRRISSLSTKHSIDDLANQQRLWHEVSGFWAANTPRFSSSSFI